MELAIIFLPLIASIISGFFGRFIGDRNSEIVTSLLVSISALLSIFVFYQVMVNGFQENILIATWINSGELNVNWSMNIDPLSAVMLVVVTSVSSPSSFSDCPTPIECTIPSKVPHSSFSSEKVCSIDLSHATSHSIRVFTPKSSAIGLLQMI